MCTALQAHPYFARSGRALADAATSPSRAAPPPARAASPPPAPPHPPKKYHTWKLLRGIGMERSYENEPDRVELYYFEHGAGEFLSAWSGERVTRLERAARPAQRLARAALAELLAAPRLLAAARGAAAAAGALRAGGAARRGGGAAADGVRRGAQAGAGADVQRAAAAAAGVRAERVARRAGGAAAAGGAAGRRGGAGAAAGRRAPCGCAPYLPAPYRLATNITFTEILLVFI
ncbi:uncharacterized protein LOC110379491 isoform X2 [Helicoverpa armigera]|uniref:uncharacterized protein LOC110379491 isoform X2 n=1 Tax=Helicoverpa armigera TaxID=29058 RepID=UPI0030839F78